MRRSPRLLPDSLFLRALAVRTSVLWVLARVVELTAQTTANEPGSPPPTFFIMPISAAGVTLLVAMLVVIDVRRRGEQVLLANLGTGTRAVFAYGALGVLLIECAVAAIGRVAWAG